VLLNLVGNAIKFTERGHVLVSVACDRVGDGQAWIRFAVEDTGIGIAETKLATIFDRFTQADTSTTRRYGGTGLGLAISAQLVELMGGTIGVESRLGDGSTFWVTLPLPLGEAAPDPPLETSLAGLRALVVDDNAVNRRVLREQLAGWQLRCDEASSGNDALGALYRARTSGDPYRLALLDHNMPDMDGEMLAGTIRSDPALGDTALILLTSMALLGDARRLVPDVFAAYLVKPVRPALLLRSLLTVCATSAPSAHTDAALHGPDTAGARQPPGDRAPSRSLSGRILLVEDNSISQKVGKRILEKLGCRVDVAANGREAVETLERTPYDLVLMDCQMPEMDGYEATAEIRRRQVGGPRIPIVAMTAHAGQADRERCLAVGMDDYVSKPISPEALMQVLMPWLGGEDTVRPDAATPTHAGPPLDLEAALRVFDGDWSAYRELVEEHLLRIAEDIGLLRRAVDDGAYRDVAAVAHRDVGASATLRLDRLVAPLRDLEERASAGRVDGAALLLTQIGAEVARVEAFLRTVDAGTLA
jgi:CheY-like chemotaxis protein